MYGRPGIQSTDRAPKTARSDESQQVFDLSCFDDVRSGSGPRLFLVYRENVQEPRCVESFAKEIANLPVDYGGPSGCLLVAWHDTRAIGCVALRAIGNGSAEAKRLYVISDQRRNGVGKT